MALHRVKSRVRFQNLTKKTKREVGHNAQGKSTRIVIGGAPERALTESPVCKEPSFAKKRVPSKDELQNLCSNLSACIAAAKAHRAQQSPCKAPPPPSSLRFERRLLESHNPEVASSELALSDPPTSLLATTAMHRSTAYPIVSVVLDVQAADGEHDSLSVDATEVAVYSEDEDDDPPVSFSIGVVDASFSTTKSSHRAHLIETIKHNFDISGAVDHSNDDLPEPCAAKQKLRITFAEPVVCPQEPLVCPRKHLSNFTKRVLILFAGRCRCCFHNIKLPGNAPEAAREQNDVTVTDSSQPKPRVGPGKVSPDLPLRHLRARQVNDHFSGAIPSLPVAKHKLPHATPSHPRQLTFLPIFSVKEQRKLNSYEGHHVVAPDIYQPAEIQTAFPSATPPRAPASPKWEQVLEEPTILEIWDNHVARFAKYRDAPAIPDNCEELARYLDALEDVRAERLRYNTGHCFGALAGDVYPYHGGLIF